MASASKTAPTAMAVRAHCFPNMDYGENTGVVAGAGAGATGAGAGATGATGATIAGATGAGAGATGAGAGATGAGAT